VLVAGGVAVAVLLGAIVPSLEQGLALVRQVVPALVLVVLDVLDDVDVLLLGAQD
jgi:hypothetical protein